MKTTVRRPVASRFGRPLILLCNDDGYFRPEIQILFRRLRRIGRTVIGSFARPPLREQPLSWCGSSRMT